MVLTAIGRLLVVIAASIVIGGVLGSILSAALSMAGVAWSL